MPLSTQYKAKSLNGAQTRVRQLSKQVNELNQIAGRYHEAMILCAKLAADGPAFYNPLHIAAAKKVRDDVLARCCGMKPDGSPLN